MVGCLWVDPAGHRVAEEDKVRYDTTGVHADHLTHPTERRVLYKQGGVNISLNRDFCILKKRVSDPGGEKLRIKLKITPTFKSEKKQKTKKALNILK